MAPLYSYKCKKHTWDDVRLISERDEVAVCPACQSVGERVLTAPVIHGFEEYADENLADEHDDKPYVVRSRGDRERRRKELGLVDVGPSQRARDLKLEKQRGRKVFAPRG